MGAILNNWQQSIIWNNAGILLIEFLGENFSEILIKFHIFLIKENALQNIVCEMVAIFSQPQCVNRYIEKSYC